MNNLTFRGAQQEIFYGEQLGLKLVICHEGNMQLRHRLEKKTKNKMELFNIFKT